VKVALKRLARTAATFQNYRNPLHIIWKRFAAGPTDMMTIVDRGTGIRCGCPLDAFHMFAGTWYQKEYDVPHVPIRREDVVIDVGANHGFFALYAASAGARVYAFEPSPVVFKRLESNIRSNRLDEKVVARPWAISSEPGHVELMITDRMGGGMSTINGRFAESSGIAITERVNVDCHTLSEILAMWGIDKVRRCKIDAEGSEIAILKGLDCKDRGRFESIVLEYHPEAYDVAELISELMSWGTHQVGFIEEKEFGCNILRAVSNEALLRPR
jgi:FkbM family methyltransferase